MPLLSGKLRKEKMEALNKSYKNDLFTIQPPHKLPDEVKRAMSVTMDPGPVSPVIDPALRNDGQGKGHFGAPRKGKKDTGHQGFDLIATPGAAVVSPVDGEITGLEPAYKVSQRYNGEFRAIKVLGEDGLTYAMRYVLPVDADGQDLVKVGDSVKRGDRIGTVQDRARVDPGMINHVHFELRKGDQFLDPESLYNYWRQFDK